MIAERNYISMVALCNYLLYDPLMPVELKVTPAAEAWQAMMTAFTRVNHVLATEMAAETQLTLDWYGILLMLSQAEHGVMQPSEVADQIGLSRSATTRLVDRLERDGLVERRACNTDGRGTFITLTPEGEKRFRQAGRVHLRGIDEHVGTHLTATELSQLKGLLTELADRVEGDALSMITAKTTN